MGALLVGLAALAHWAPASFVAAGILRPLRVTVTLTTELEHQDFDFKSGELTLRGWKFAARAPRKGVVLYLHGHNSNRWRSADLARALGPLGYEVIGYDSRAHGASDGEFCTFGFYEKSDLARALDAIGEPHVIVVGASLGGAVALMAAPSEPRICAIAAQAPFVDLDEAIRDRTAMIDRGCIEDGIRLAEQKAQFQIGELSPLKAAPSIAVPVLLIHGTADGQTPLSHSQRIYEVLTGRKRLLTVEGAGHVDVWQRDETWSGLTDWVVRVTPNCMN